MTDNLRDQISKVSKQIADLEAKIDADVRFFEKNQVPFHSRVEAELGSHLPRYDQMLYFEKKLDLAQQKLTSLLLESLKGSTDELGGTTTTLLKSSHSLGHLTRYLILVTFVILAQAFIGYFPLDEVQAARFLLVAATLILLGYITITWALDKN